MSKKLQHDRPARCAGQWCLYSEGCIVGRTKTVVVCFCHRKKPFITCTLNTDKHIIGSTCWVFQYVRAHTNTKSVEMCSNVLECSKNLAHKVLLELSSLYIINSLCIAAHHNTIQHSARKWQRCNFDCGLRMRRECWERFRRHRLQRKPSVC